MITWFSNKHETGQASLYSSNITLNKTASVPFEFAYRVQVGMDEKKNVVIEPLSKERVERGDLDEYCLLEIKIKASYSRICSTDLMRAIGKSLGLSLEKNEPAKFITIWKEKENHLLILTGEGENQ